MDSCIFDLYADDAVLCIGPIKKSQYLTVKEIRQMDCTGQANIFYTPNALGERHGRYWRNRQHLETFECLYCDIDLDPYVDPVAAIEHIKAHAIAGAEVPYPTQINVSGRGIHLFWKINSLPYTGNIEKWQAMQQYIYECFRGEGADPKVTRDTVRLLRMPGTLNVKDSGTTRAYMYEYSGCVYELDTLITEYDIKYKLHKPRNARKKAITRPQRHCFEPQRDANGKVVSFYTLLYQKRVRDLETLLLQHRDYDRAGRENILFLYRYYLCHLTGDAQKALDGTLILNSHLQHPLTDKEVISATKSAEKYYNGAQLNWTNAKIIEFLDITDEEMRDMVTLISCAEKQRRKQARNKAYYTDQLRRKGKAIKKDAIEQRRIRLHELRLQGKDRKEICQLLQIGKSTYYEDLKAISSEIWLKNYAREKEREVAEAVATGTDGDSFGYSENFSSRNYVCSVPGGVAAPVAAVSVRSDCRSSGSRGYFGRGDP